ncbi:hypothetical protein CANCADRAFT_31024 [Tortispora caseinolytica NRRL Y-17796]|uniref:Uncharacterized protein n=1 Tax=Tortispora caseinolytica NRRL Y-17796 TaxID=767744 RepID=A0A1E4TE43_9ASCO|nr:hypothetical protein CANCADRAFT_31024 [Tortispora caseinolytica NRRL Y-17796]
MVALARFVELNYYVSILLVLGIEDGLRSDLCSPPMRIPDPQRNVSGIRGRKRGLLWTRSIVDA